MGNMIEKLGEMTPDNLIADVDVKQITASGILPAGSGEVKRGTVLSLSEGELYVMAEGATPYGILCDTVNVGDADETVEIYLTGKFNKNALIVADGYTLTAEDIQALRVGGIYVENSKK